MIGFTNVSQNDCRCLTLSDPSASDSAVARTTDMLPCLVGFIHSELPRLSGEEEGCTGPLLRAPLSASDEFHVKIPVQTPTFP